MSLVIPNWPLPARIRLGWTDRSGGVSPVPFDEFNLAHHVGDRPDAVEANRTALLASMTGCRAIRWFSQVHGTTVVDAAHSPDGTEADAAWTDRPGLAPCVMTADCLPVFFWQRDGTAVAVAHAGWRGLAGGVLDATLARFPDPGRVECALGPAIGPDAFEVGTDVREAFADWPGADGLFQPRRTPGKWLADLPGLAESLLRALGVARVYRADHCTFSRPEQYYSYRREGTTGRMANLIWIT